ncbi:GGDEF domain-containing protein [Deferribacter autotrophicus]|uniref:diguanylate cyclase n=1 Tax=Deferribacter autotrophicus TaxID=500465 RepID=A0A5A8F5B0_9BACT|nr:GGDEF domain-containing protein [Deferribacter autotrophicus]KAA0259324.1 GGDEF domain-containing protein [Deferribacter autotrophicus]
MPINLNDFYDMIVTEIINILKKIKDNNEDLSINTIKKYLLQNERLTDFFNKNICIVGVEAYKSQISKLIKKVEDILPKDFIENFEENIKNTNDICKLNDILIDILSYLINFLIRVINTFNKSWDLLKEILKYMEISNEKLFKVLESSREIFIEEIRNNNELTNNLEELEKETKLENDIEKLKNKLISKLNEIKTNLREKENIRKEKFNKFDSDVKKIKNDLEKYRKQVNQLQESIKRYKKEAVVDLLTNVYNRNFLDRKLAEEFEKFHRYKSPLSVIMLDVDDFKAVNDNYGHQIGDQVLKYFANVIKNNIRKVDIPFRYGGEEFFIVLPHTRKEQAKVVANRILKELNETVFKVKGDRLKITASIGVTEAKENDSVETLIKRVDDLLLKAKKEGKNRIISG